MLSVVLDFEEDNAEVFFAMDDAEVELTEDGGIVIVFEDHHTGRTVQVGIGAFLLEQMRRIKESANVGCHYIEEPQGPYPFE